MSSGAPGSLQAGLSKFHDIVCTLVRNYTTTTAQVQYMWGGMLYVHICVQNTLLGFFYQAVPSLVIWLAIFVIFLVSFAQLQLV